MIFSKANLPALMLAVSLMPLHAMAQESDVKLNVSVSGGYCVNNGVSDILVPEDYYSNYEFKDKGQFVLGGNVLCLYHKPTSVLGVEGGFAYYQKYTDLSYSDNQGLEYTVEQRYHYLGLMAAIKIYPWKHGFNVSAGGRVSAILSPKGISYTSNQEDEKFSKFEWATTSETERQMNEKLTARPDAAIGGGLGYEFSFGLNLNLRYYYGLSNTIRTETNDFNWAEKKNNSHSIEFSVGYLFNL